METVDVNKKKDELQKIKEILENGVFTNQFLYTNQIYSEIPSDVIEKVSFKDLEKEFEKYYSNKEIFVIENFLNLNTRNFKKVPYSVLIKIDTEIIKKQTLTWFDTKKEKIQKIIENPSLLKDQFQVSFLKLDRIPKENKKIEEILITEEILKNLKRNIENINKIQKAIQNPNSDYIEIRVSDTYYPVYTNYKYFLKIKELEKSIKNTD
jgi:hypothetical protein